jgi:hypothetical protein
VCHSVMTVKTVAKPDLLPSQHTNPSYEPTHAAALHVLPDQLRDGRRAVPQGEHRRRLRLRPMEESPGEPRLRSLRTPCALSGWSIFLSVDLLRSGVAISLGMSPCVLTGLARSLSQLKRHVIPHCADAVLCPRRARSDRRRDENRHSDAATPRSRAAAAPRRRLDPEAPAARRRSSAPPRRLLGPEAALPRRRRGAVSSHLPRRRCGAAAAPPPPRDAPPPCGAPPRRVARLRAAWRASAPRGAWWRR